MAAILEVVVILAIDPPAEDVVEAALIPAFTTISLAPAPVPVVVAVAVGFVAAMLLG